jgi:3-hydroxymyristoyl/3-hydroxydecanoyl-(acyl carrier protein) dehydratase
MMESWDIPANLTFEPPNIVILEAMVPHYSPWFSGHFPGEPILPGIALIFLVMKALRYFGEGQGFDLQSFGVRKARFNLPIRPGETFEISLLCRTSEDELISSFKVLLKGEMAGNGIVQASLRK